MPSTTSEKSIMEHRKKGNGQGQGSAYTPWIPRQHGPRNTYRHQIPGEKISRDFVLFGSLEYAVFHLLEWMLNVSRPGHDTIVDIREQYPLWTWKDTLEIAKQCGVSHSTYSKSKHPIVMTSDFCITMETPSGRQYDIIRTVKPTEKLEKQTKVRKEYQILKKFEIERRYWEKKNIDWGIITEREINKTLTHNLEKVRTFYNPRHQLKDLSKQEISDIARVLTNLATKNSSLPLQKIASQCDHQLGFTGSETLGTSQSTVYYLIANRHWIVDLYTRIDPAKPLHIISSSIDNI